MADDQKAPAIAPPLIILICIGGAVLAVVIVAALYRLCRQGRAEADGELDGKTWNPNKRSQEQMKYMEEVRWRNNADAWERSREGRQSRGAYKRGWFQEHLEAQRTRDHAGSRWTPADFPEEFLPYVQGNPYQELLEQRMAQTKQQTKPSRGKEHGEAHSSPNHPVLSSPDNAVPPEPEAAQPNNSGIRVTMNDESDDIVDFALPSSSKFPPRQSRMFRSSSIYSGGDDTLLPSNHLHMVQSSSNYALSDDRTLRVRQGIEEWEQRNRPQ